MSSGTGKIVIIGSGLTAVSAARSLIGRGAQVVMVDGGERLEQATQQHLQTLRDSDPSQWDRATVDKIASSTKASVKGVSTKLVYGSDFPYRWPEDHTPASFVRSKMHRSLAVGGLANAWGASVLPNAQEDMKGWPVTLAELEAHYRAVMEFLPVATHGRGALDAALPTYSSDPQTFQPSRQAQLLHRQCSRHQEALSDKGILFGYSRLAVDFEGREQPRGCVSCGMCLHGCPYGLIFDGSTALEELKGKPGFTHLSGYLVTSFKENDGGVQVSMRERHGGGEQTISCDRLFVAAGTLASTQLVMHSLHIHDTPVVIRHSDHFLLPLLAHRGTPQVGREELHTLTQMYLLVRNRKVSRHNVNLQIYTYNDLFRQAVDNLAGPLARSPLARVIDWSMGRILVCQGYLHSKDSSWLEATLAGDGSLSVVGRQRERAFGIMNRLVKLLFLNQRLFGAMPFPLPKMSLPGDGNHSGGSFPMAERPGPLQSDVLGRPHGLKKVHLVDASVLPEIAATTISLTAMANAHRIASLVNLN